MPRKMRTNMPALTSLALGAGGILGGKLFSDSKKKNKKKGARIEAAKAAAASIDTSPIDKGGITIDEHEMTDAINNRASVLKASGGDNDFVWGHLWGNSKTRESE